MNSIGTLFRLTSFGESHGAAIGGVVDGCPAGIELDLDFIQSELNRRKPGQSRLTTARKEGDRVEIFGSNLPVTVLSDAMNTIDYEVLTSVSNRVKRIYYY